MKFIWRTDVHFSDETPRRRKDNWTQTVAEKLKWIGQYAKEIDAKAVIDGGDFFDVKTPSKNSHQLIRQTISIHQDYHCPIYSVFGNHDAKHANIDFLEEQPLGVLYQSKIFQPLLFAKPHDLINQSKQKHSFFENSHEAVFEENGIKVRWVAIPYHGKVYDLEWINRIEKKDEDYLFVAAHLLASSKYKIKGSMFGSEDIIGYDFLKQHQGHVDAWFFGHWHEDQGILNLDEDQENATRPRYVVNIGSLTRGSLAMKDLTNEHERLPAIAVVHVDQNGFHIEKKILDIAKRRDEVFKVEELTFESRVKDETKKINHLLSDLSNQQEYTLEQMISEIEIEEEEVAHRLRHYIEQVKVK
jgi:DNA repair exonuclease SbcCD nuclease subunit